MRMGCTEMKKWVSLAIVVMMLFTGCVVFAEDIHVDEDGELLDNPIHEAATLDELLAAVPGVVMSDAPEGSTEVSYAWIHTEPEIAQIQFCYGDDYYTYRAAVTETPETPADIDGLYLPFDVAETFDNIFEDGAAFQAYSSSDEDYVVIHWVRPDAKCQYSLFSETAGGDEMRIMEVIEKVFPAGTAEKLEDNE